MRLLRLLLYLLIAVWALLSLYVFYWFRERHGRGGPFPASQAGMLLHPLRARLQSARPTLERFGIKEGQVALELGPGPGYFTVEAARMVGTAGEVVCLDVQPGMVEALRARLDQHGVANAHPLVGDAARLPLADGSVDAAFLVAVLGEIPDRVAALRELRRVLKPGGVVSFWENLTDPDYVFQRELRDLCRATGFEEAALQREPLGYTMVFRAG